MKNLKRLMIILIIFIILIIMILGVLLVLISGNTKQDEELLEESFEVANKLEKMDSMEEYFYIKNCMENYKTYSLDLYYVQEYKEDAPPLAEEYKKELLDIIAPFVKEELDLNTENAYQKVGLPDKQLRIEKIYKSTQTINTQEYENETEIYAYVVEFTLIDRENYQQDKNKTIVLIDFNNYTYYIVPQLYIEQKGLKINEGDSLLLYQENAIGRNDYNGFKSTSKTKTRSDTIEEYLARIRMGLQYDIEDVYNLLEEDYRNIRFGGIEKFKEYVETNKTDLMKITPTKYKIDETEEYTQYTILDQNEDYYIFRETGVMEYRVILDTYTIDLPEFLEKYNTASEQEKVAMNINKFVEAINAKDYTYAYSKIADSFKNNYFKTQKSFEDYIKTHFYERNTITFNNFKNQANTYIYTTIITDKATNQKKEQNFIVRLKEGTDFEMSFEV